MGAALDKIISAGLIILLVFTALAFGTVEPWSVALFELAVTVLLILWAVKTVRDGQFVVLIPSIAWPVFGLLLVGLVQSVAVTEADGQIRSLSADVEATRLRVLLLGCLLAAQVLAANFLTKRDRIESVGRFLAFYGLLFAVFGLAQHFSWNGKFFWLIEPTFPKEGVFGPFVNRNHFAGYVEMLMPIPLAMVLLKSVRRDARLFYGFAAVAMGVAAVISLSRGGLVSMFSSALFALTVSLWIGQKRRVRAGQPLAHPRALLVSRFSVGALVIATIIGGIFWVGVDPVLDRLTKSQVSGEAGPGMNTLYSSRGVIWDGTLDLIAANPILGVGLGAFQTAFPRYSKWDSAYTPVAEAHNDYLQVLADAGMVGGGLALWFLVVFLRSFFRGVQHPDPALAALALGAGSGVFALLVHSFFDFNLQLPSNSLLFLLLAAMVSVIGTPARSQKTAKTI